MANHKSAEKRHRQSLKKRELNRRTKSAVRTMIKKVRAAIKLGDIEQAKSFLVSAEKSVQTAASKGVYKKKTASRYVSRLAIAVNELNRETQTTN
jgi:small subunit ribosomal protein S20